MLSVYDLYDLHTLFVCIRSSPDDALNYNVIGKIINVLDNRYINNESNQFRVALQSIDQISTRDLYSFVFTKNKYCYYPLPFLDNERIYKVLINSCKELQNIMVEKDINKIYDLADCLHNLPIYVVESRYSIPNTYWKNEIKYYRKKWNKDFLLNEEKLFSKFKL